jgi:hypothetical protein
MNSQPDHEATPNKKMYRGSWLLEYKAQLKWAGLAALLLLLAGALPSVLSAYNATGQCLSRLSKLSESEMKLRVLKSFVAHKIDGKHVPEGSQRNRKIMFLGRSITQQELIERSQAGTLLDLLNEQPLLLSNEDQLNQFSAKIETGEFTILDHLTQSYVLDVLPGKSLKRADSRIAIAYFNEYKDMGRFNKYLNNFGNHLYEYDSYALDTACCNGKPLVSKEDVIDVKKRNLEAINFRKRFPEHRWSFPVSNCGSVWFPPHPQDQ